MQSKLILTALCLTALLTGFYLQLFGLNLPSKKYFASPEIEGFLWPEQKALSNFEMVAPDNSPFTLENLSDNWSLMFFGYTHCPDICPITMNTLRQAREKVTQDTRRSVSDPNIVFISVDGERDTPEHLKNYLSFFGEGFTGATGNPNQVDSLTSQLGIPYAVEDHEPGDTNYLVNHSGVILLISPQGTLASVFQPPHDAASIAKRYSRIVDFMSGNS